MAELQDQMFYNRIVNGMKERQGQAKFDRLQQQSQSLIDTFALTRHPVISPSTRKWTSDDYSVLPESSGGESLLTQTLAGAIDHDHSDREEEELIFQLDL